MSAMNFDKFLATVGDWGRFQKVKYTLICLTYMLPPIMVYTYTFTAATPNFRCRNPDSALNDSYTAASNQLFNDRYQVTEEQCKRDQKLISTKECQRCYRLSTRQSSAFDNDWLSEADGSLQKCDDFVYEKEFYQQTLVEEWTMVCDRVIYRSTVQMIFFTGYMVGSIVFGMLADQYGRRPIMSVSFLLMTFSGFLCAFGPQEALGFWPSYLIFIIARFLLACSTRGISVSGFVLGSEIVGPKKRLLAGIVIEYFFAFGQLFLVLFAYFIRTWRTLTWSISLFTVPFIFFYFILPESPRWLVSKGRYKDAEKVLRRMAVENQRNFEPEVFAQLQEEQEKNMSNKHNQGGVMSLFRSRIMLIISLNLFFQWLVQNLVFYGVSQNTGSWKLNPYLAFTVSALVELLAYIIVHLILDRIGRKLPYCFFALLFGIVALCVVPVQKYMTKNSQAQTILMNIINGALKFLASASYAIIYIYANELFPTNVRNTGMGICSMVARIGAIAGTFFNDFLTRIWIYLPVVLYGIVSLLAALCAFMFPETLNKPLPQSVADVEEMGISGFRRGKPQGTVAEGQHLTQPDNIEITQENLRRNHVESVEA